jgi:hypothetical protein
MKYRVVVRPEAEDDLKEAYSWYEIRGQGWGMTSFCKLMLD